LRKKKKEEKDKEAQAQEEKEKDAPQEKVKWFVWKTRKKGISSQQGHQPLLSALQQ